MSNLPRPEHPRPQFVRDSWMNLNGEWEFRFDLGNSGIERDFHRYEIFKNGDVRPITVPFCPESRLSGIGYVDWIAAVWYSRTVTLTAEQVKGRVLIHFGAVDYHSVLWVNETRAGEHKGGYSSFTYDITDLVHEGENRLTLYAEDDLRSGKQPFGKQSDRYQSYACSYTRTTGIWQTVWLEFVPENYIKYAKITPFVTESCVRIEAEVSGGTTVTAEAFYDGRPVGKASAQAVYGIAAINLPLDELHLWDVGQPELYDLVLTLDDTDTVNSYFGMRSIDLKPDGLYLNGKPLFMRTVLDQGFNPEGIYTGPSDEFLKHDIELSMALGFNGARLHQRVFEERTLYWADRLGYIVWGEYANGVALCDASGIGNFLPEWMEVVRRDYSHPSIIGWCPENESYWRKDNNPICQTMFYDVTKQMDPYRPVIDASGGVHWKTDMFDVHDYDQNPDSLRKNLARMVEDPTYLHNPIHQEQLKKHVYRGEPFWISEYGGTYWKPGDKTDGWGYGSTPESEKAFAERYAGLTKVLLECPRVCGFCYTQLTDIEQEQNGLYAYDRSPKFTEETYAKIREANMTKAAIEK